MARAAQTLLSRAWNRSGCSTCLSFPQTFDSESCALVEEFKPEIVSFHFGLPAQDLLDRVKATKACVIGSATTVREARRLESHGCDAVIAMGSEAGGHRGGRS